MFQKRSHIENHPAKPFYFGLSHWNFTFHVLNKRGSQTGCPFYSTRKADLEVRDPQQPQNNEDDRDHDQDMDPTAGLREAGANVPPEKAEQPEDD
jgi:hypothetical protein